MTNVWLYVAGDPETISISCQGIREEQLRVGAGILRIAGGCTVESGTTILRSSIDSTVRATVSFVKAMNISQLTVNASAPAAVLTSSQPIELFQPIIHTSVPALSAHEYTHRAPSHLVLSGIIVPFSATLLSHWQLEADAVLSYEIDFRANKYDQSCQQSQDVQHFERKNY
ncbi:hypothetical protein DMENIID0001_162050 [Sergentomyia squamirostris]